MISKFPSAENIYQSFMEELRTEYVAPAKRERPTPDTSPTSSLLGGVTATTPDAPRRKGPAARAPNALAKLLLNSAEDVYQTVMEELRAKYVAPAIVEAKRERHMRVLMSLRRVLKWTYAYGYYITEKEKAKREFFEYLQGEAEAGLERLHQCAEKELEVYLTEKNPERDFNCFRTKLSGLTSVTRTFFENLVKALENGLSDVNSHVPASRNASSKSLGRSNSGKKGREEPITPRSNHSGIVG